MASGGERRMVFDTRGRRKHVVRVVYAILAVLMGASLFLVVGPINIGSLLGNSTTPVTRPDIRRTDGTDRTQAETKPGRRGPAELADQSADQPGWREERNQRDDRRSDDHRGSQDRVRRAFDAWKKYEKQAGGEISPGLALSWPRPTSAWR